MLRRRRATGPDPALRLTVTGPVRIARIGDAHVATGKRHRSCASRAERRRDAAGTQAIARAHPPKCVAQGLPDCGSKTLTVFHHALSRAGLRPLLLPASVSRTIRGTRLDCREPRMGSRFRPAERQGRGRRSRTPPAGGPSTRFIADARGVAAHHGIKGWMHDRRDDGSGPPRSCTRTATRSSASASRATRLGLCPLRSPFARTLLGVALQLAGWWLIRRIRRDPSVAALGPATSARAGQGGPRWTARRAGRSGAAVGAAGRG